MALRKTLRELPLGELLLERMRQEGRRAANVPQASPHQALRVPHRPIWASQFHPELDRKANEDRYRHYLDGYAPHMSAEELAAALERFDDSPEASDLLRRFMELVTSYTHAT